MSRHWPRRGEFYTRPQRSLVRRLLDYGLTAALFGLLILLAARLDRGEERKFGGVLVVNDGDSITLSGERVRLRGIDAPEYTQVCQNGGVDYLCGKFSRAALVRLIGNSAVSCTGSRRDSYHRLLGDCTAGGADLNRAQVESGWAVAYGDFKSEEAKARAGRLGIWAGSFEEPQDWRRDHGGTVEPRHDDVLARIGDWLKELFRFW